MDGERICSLLRRWIEGELRIRKSKEQEGRVHEAGSLTTGLW